MKADGSCRRQVEAEERAELLARRTTGGPPGWRRAGADEEAALKGHVNNSKRILEEAYQTGTAVLGNMAGQRERLKVIRIFANEGRAVHGMHVPIGGTARRDATSASVGVGLRRSNNAAAVVRCT